MSEEKEEQIENESQEMTLENIQQQIDLARLELEKTKQQIEEKKKEFSSPNPRRDISEDEQKIIDKQNKRTKQNKSSREIIEKLAAYRKEMVTGRFMNRLSPGKTVKLPYHLDKGDPEKWYTLKDGHVYTIPRGFVDQINGGSEKDPCYYTPVFVQKTADQMPHSETVGENSAIAAVDASTKRYAFVPIGFDVRSA
jgi:hypothetical protein